MNNALLRDAVRRGLHTCTYYGIAGTVLAFGTAAVPTLAQNADQDQATSPEKLETITVTGSNIRRVDIETSNPIVTIDRAAIERSGKLTLGDLVQQLPSVTGPGTNPQVNNGGGTGTSSIGLRGLGGARTLVLVNGHRVHNGDPNTIPANMIERIEVLTDGASSVYGSDAVAGVVNFILRKSYQGAEFAADYGISDHDDGLRKGYHFSFGQTTDKGSIMAGIDYSKQEGVLSAHRKFSQNAVSISGSSVSVGGSLSSARGYIKLPANLAHLFPGGCASGPYKGFIARNDGASGANVATDYHCFTTSDKYNYAAINLVMTPQERTNLFLSGTYKLTDNVEAYLEAYHNKTSSAFQLAEAVFQTVGGVVISKDNYYNPFGVDFQEPGGSRFYARAKPLGPRGASFGSNSDQFDAGFKGKFSIFNQDWTWDAGFDYGHFSQTFATTGLYDLNKLNPGAGPSFLDPATGQVTCGTSAAPIAGCLPYNPFNMTAPSTIAAFRAAAVVPISNNYSQDRIEHVDFTGGVFDLPAGSVQLAAGASYHETYIHSKVDPLLTNDPITFTCTAGSQCATPLQGGYNVKEAYAELLIPVLKDVPFAQALNVSLGDRYSKYSLFGHTNNIKLALEWRPIEDLLLRGTVSEVFRAPTAIDEFAGPANNADKISRDPCDHFVASAPATSGPCVNVPIDGSFVNSDVAGNNQTTVTTSGAAYAHTPLVPENGKSFDFGVVYDPHWLPGLSVSADIWRVYLNNIIAAAGLQSILDLCNAGQQRFCNQIHRFSDGQIAPATFEPTGNLGRVDVGGVDFTGTYRLPETRFGRFRVALNTTYLKNYDQQTAPGLPGSTTYHFAGHFMTFGSAAAGACPSSTVNGATAVIAAVCLFPRWRALGALNWQFGALDANWKVRYIGRFRMGSPAPSQDVHPVGNAFNNVFFDFGATVYNDLSVGYNIEPLNARIDVGIDNVTDKQPPFLYANNTLNGNTDPNDFDLMGRFYWTRVSVKF